MQLANTKMKVGSMPVSVTWPMLMYFVQLDEHVSNIEGEAADAKQLAGAPGRPTAPEEGEEGTIEKKLKGSLLSTLRQRFEGETNHAAAGQQQQAGTVSSPYFGGS
jgi:hypothetical protein